MKEFLLFGVLVGILIYFLTRVTEKISYQNQINIEQTKEIQNIKERLLLASQIQNHLKNGIEKTRDLLEELKKTEEIRKEKEKEFLERVKRIDEILGGTSSKGVSGEEILRETFKKLPPEMIESNFKVRGRVVEFALILPNNKRLPIDSKWPAGNLVLSLEKETDFYKKKDIIEDIEREVIKRIKEVKQYIDPNLTWSQAIAAIPDSVYSVCKLAHLKATEDNVILMPYSMVLPLILYMYRLHLQYAISVDKENWKDHLINIIKSLDEMEEILENKIFRSATMIQNAYLEYRNFLSKIRSSVEGLKGSQKKEELKC